MLKFEAKKGDFAKIWQKLGGGSAAHVDAFSGKPILKINFLKQLYDQMSEFVLIRTYGEFETQRQDSSHGGGNVLK